MPRPLVKKLKRNEFYCICCRRRVRAKPADIYIEQDRVGRHRMRSLHGSSSDGCELYKYVKEKDVKMLKKKYN